MKRFVMRWTIPSIVILFVLVATQVTNITDGEKNTWTLIFFVLSVIILWWIILFVDGSYQSVISQRDQLIKRWTIWTAITTQQVRVLLQGKTIFSICELPEEWFMEVTQNGEIIKIVRSTTNMDVEYDLDPGWYTFTLFGEIRTYKGEVSLELAAGDVNVLWYEPSISNDMLKVLHARQYPFGLVTSSYHLVDSVGEKPTPVNPEHVDVI